MSDRSRSRPNRRAPGRPAEFPFHEPQLFGGKGHRFEIENSVVFDRGLESIRMADDPVDGITAIAGARNTRLVCVHKRHLRHGIEDGVEIRHHLAAPVLRDLINESLAKTGRTAGIWRCNDPSLRRP